MPVQDTGYNPEKTILVTPDKQRFPVHESEKPFVVTSNSFLIRKVGAGIMAALFLLGGIYIIFSSQNKDNNSLDSPVEVNIPASSPTGFIRIDPATVGLPEGWQRIESGDGSFDIGFAPETMQTNVSAAKLTLTGKQGDLNFTMELLPYDGGGRHEFILRKMKVIDITGLGSDANTHEQIYDIGERRALIIYGVDYNGVTVIGMLQKDEVNAFLIQASGMTQNQIEEILYTIRIL